MSIMQRICSASTAFLRKQKSRRYPLLLFLSNKSRVGAYSISDAITLIMECMANPFVRTSIDQCISFVLLFFCLKNIYIHKKHNTSDPSSLARTRDLISMIAQCLRGHSADPLTRFLVPARNDAVVAYVITIIYRKARLPNEAVLHVYLAHRAFYLAKQALHIT